VSAAGDFIDLALQDEASWYRASDAREQFGDALQFYGSSVGAVRGTVRDALNKFSGMSHDEVTALSSELWKVPVFERRLAAVVLLQSNVALLVSSDLTRLEGFVRSAELTELVDPLVKDVIRPLLVQLPAASRTRADTILERWSTDPSELVRRAAQLARS
jgi:hypothetical protein